MTEDDWIRYGEQRPKLSKSDKERLHSSQSEIEKAHFVLESMDNTPDDIRDALYFKFVLGNDIVSAKFKSEIDWFLQTKDMTAREKYTLILSNLLEDVKGSSSSVFHNNIQENGILHLADLLEKIKGV
jgi:hypothetical protein